MRSVKQLYEKSRFTPKQAEEFSHAKTRGFIICSRNSIGALNAFWDWCCQEKRPYVKIHPGRIYAEVHIDVDPMYRGIEYQPHTIPIPTQEQFRELLREWGYEGYFTCGDYMLGVERIPIGQAEQLAYRLLHLVRKPTPNPGVVCLADLMPKETQKHMVKIYKSANNGEFVIQTTCDNPEDFVEGFLHAFLDLVTQQDIPDTEFICRSVPSNFLPLVNKLGGYKAERVNEQRVLTCGFATPDDEETKLLASYGR